jgi:hypothetical protein
VQLAPAKDSIRDLRPMIAGMHATCAAARHLQSWSAHMLISLRERLQMTPLLSCVRPHTAAC